MFLDFKVNELPSVAIFTIDHNISCAEDENYLRDFSRARARVCVYKRERERERERERREREREREIFFQNLCCLYIYIRLYQ